ncbi:hypothetical protein L596_013376 [Steinernema carpocapsae]|uniref:Uncharacterized protein n=1 Tax=Steinernema carpocapsae TaxID=34508 RepID=A0A4U5P0G2_STECR|nr:hypothetical protein L596_013376 [Steinernema carpocapsae]
MPALPIESDVHLGSLIRNALPTVSFPHTQIPLKCRRQFRVSIFALSTMLFSSVVLLSLPVVFGLCMDAPDETVSQWQSFVSQHDKVYESAEEETRRFEIFRHNLDKIRQLNDEHGGVTTFGINKFSDMSEEEFSRMFFEEAHNKDEESYSLYPDIEALPEPPASKDWSKIVNLNVKNQNSCGDCYIFSVLGAIEAHKMIQNPGRKYDLSEQEVLDCGKQFDCVGGSRSVVYGFVQDNGVTVAAAYQPYSARKNRFCMVRRNTPMVRIQNFRTLPKGDENVLRKVVGNAGPVSVGIYASTQFQHYHSGVINVSNCPKTTNHAVLAVGYGVDKKTGTKYWKIKNSYGKKWGEEGYFRIARDAGNMLIMA